MMMPLHEHHASLSKTSIFLKLMTPEIPDTSDGFVLILKRYENLNFALFSDTIPLFWSLVKIVDSIKALSQVTYNAMTIKTKA